jgi:hypothetical protein
MMRVRATVLGLALLIAGAGSVDAQMVQNSFQVAAYTGYQGYAGGSSLRSGAWTLGGAATYYVSSAVGLGFWTDLSFPEADGAKFPLASLDFNDSTTLNSINQGIQMWNFGAHAKFQLPNARTAPWAMVGGGGYLMFLDSQQQDRLRSESGIVVLLGLGVDFAVSEAVGFQLSFQDHWYPSWGLQDDIFRIWPVDPEPVGLTNRLTSALNTRFPELNGNPDDLSNSIHNFSVVAGVTFVPGR